MIRAAFLAACFLATQPNIPECSCIHGHPELDWMADHDALTDPADCPRHGATTE